LVVESIVEARITTESSKELIMNTNLKKTMSWAAAVALVGGGTFAVTAQAQVLPETAALTTVSAAADADLAEDLQLMREEERMARDLYKAFADKYDNAAPFSRITVSEDRHYDAVGVLLDRYEVSDPSAGKAAGTYAYPEIQKLYDGWLAEGNASVQAAYQVGVELETADIADLKAAINEHTEADVDQVFGSLLMGSEHHLEAFQAAVDGKVLGTQDGSGRMNRWGGSDERPNGPGNGPGNGAGRMGMGGGGAGMGPGDGVGYGMTGERPADCPMLDDTDES
jgi:hypothetical protein